MIQVYSATAATALLTALWMRDNLNVERATSNIKVLDDEIDRECELMEVDVRREAQYIHKLTMRGFALQKDKQIEFLQCPWYNRVILNPPRPDGVLARRYAEDLLKMESSQDVKDLHRLEMTKVQMLS